MKFTGAPFEVFSNIGLHAGREATVRFQEFRHALGGGAYGSTYDVDPSVRLVKVLMIQLIPNKTDIQEKFSNGVYQAIVN